MFSTSSLYNLHPSLLIILFLHLSLFHLLLHCSIHTCVSQSLSGILYYNSTVLSDQVLRFFSDSLLFTNMPCSQFKSGNIHTFQTSILQTVFVGSSSLFYSLLSRSLYCLFFPHTFFLFWLQKSLHMPPSVFFCHLTCFQSEILSP